MKIIVVLIEQHTISIDTHYNGTQHNDTQQNDTQHNDTQHNGRVLLCCVIYADFYLCYVTFKPIMVIVAMPNVVIFSAVMLSAMAPSVGSN